MLDRRAFERLRETPTLRGDAFDRWFGARLAIAGCGVLGSRFALEAVRSGACVHLFDPDTAVVENLGTLPLPAGRPKVDSTVAACDEVAPGRARGSAADVRHAGPGFLARSALIVDATDDPGLAVFLTEVSNGLGVPLLRLAVDGSGTLELGRVLASHGGAGHACQLCSRTSADIAASRGRTPCPGRPPPDRPTLAGGALAAATAGLALLQAQRIVGGAGRERALDHEIVLDLSHDRAFAVALRRSAACLSGHRRWSLVPLPLGVAGASVADLFALARTVLGGRPAVIEPFGHPVLAGASCPSCAAVVRAAGTAWAAPPVCPACGASCEWRDDLACPALDEPLARELGILDRSLDALGLPPGAMVCAHSPAGRRVELLLSAGSAGPATDPVEVTPP